MVRRRSRSCDSPAPANGGNECDPEEATEEEEKCKIKKEEDCGECFKYRVIYTMTLI